MASVTPTAITAEAAAERRLVDGVKALGGLCLKWPATATAGVPDRILILGGRVLFVEMKREGGKLSAIQEHLHRKLRAVGADVRVVYGVAGVRALLDEIAAPLV